MISGPVTAIPDPPEAFYHRGGDGGRAAEAQRGVRREDCLAGYRAAGSIVVSAWPWGAMKTTRNFAGLVVLAFFEIE